MATYKVLQDIEAEDKLIGPLTLRQFIYAAIGAIFLYLSYLLATKGAGFMLVVFLPISAVAGFFAFPWMRDQPTEVWALAKIRFMVKPRRRIWNQDGIKELVTVTAPKQQNVDYTNGLSQQEVRSRLRALATTVDTRGWAIKNTNLTIPIQGSGLPASDRLVQPLAASPAKSIDVSDIQASDDILDENNNADAQRLQSMIDQKTKAHREELMASLKNDAPTDSKPAANNYWFLNQPAAAAKIPNDMVTFSTQVVTPGSTGDNTSTTAADEASMLAELDAHQVPIGTTYTGHMHTIVPLSKQKPAAKPMPPVPAVQQNQTPTPPPAQNAYAPVTPQDSTAILPLASNNDLSVATIAREAGRTTSGDEVVVKLH
jgi:hypothetical protein